MANLYGIARPYALAAFEYARDHKQLPAWFAFLQAAATAVGDEALQKLLKNPSISSHQLNELLNTVLQSVLDEERKNFLLLLAQNKRLVVLPEIFNLFSTYLAQYEKMSTVRVVSAVALDDNFRQKLIDSLSKRLQRDVQLKEELDPAILGGAIIHVGDRVIDGSIRGKLSRLLENLTG